MNLNPVNLIKELRVNSGPLEGAFVVAPAGKINWYFANLGLQGIARKLSPEDLDHYVRKYLDCFISQLEADSTIFDVVGTTKIDPDSHDSYASTFLSLAALYVRLSNNKEWYLANQSKLNDIAYFNLTTQIKPNKLITTFQSPHPYNVGFNMDNCENYRGLIDYSYLLKSFNNTNDLYFFQMAEDVATGLKGLYDPMTKAFKPSDVATGVEKSFYPGTTTQIFAQAFGVLPLSSYYASAWKFLVNNSPYWRTLAYDPFPWMILSTVAAKRGATSQAKAQLAACDKLFATDRAKVTINELGWYQRTLNILNCPNEA